MNNWYIHIELSLWRQRLPTLPHYHSAWQWSGFEHGRLRCKSVIETFTLPIGLRVFTIQNYQSLCFKCDQILIDIKNMVIATCLHLPFSVENTLTRKILARLILSILLFVPNALSLDLVHKIPAIYFQLIEYALGLPCKGEKWIITQLLNESLFSLIIS